jgi:hypothetical protein
MILAYHACHRVAYLEDVDEVYAEQKSRNNDGSGQMHVLRYRAETTAIMRCYTVILHSVRISHEREVRAAQAGEMYNVHGGTLEHPRSLMIV